MTKRFKGKISLVVNSRLLEATIATATVATTCEAPTTVLWDIVREATDWLKRSAGIVSMRITFNNVVLDVCGDDFTKDLFRVYLHYFRAMGSRVTFHVGILEKARKLTRNDTCLISVDNVGFDGVLIRDVAGKDMAEFVLAYLQAKESMTLADELVRD